MSGAHYIVGITRSRSPSPVGFRPDRERTGSVTSGLDNPAADFGEDGRPRRGSSRRSAEFDPERQHVLPREECSPALISTSGEFWPMTSTRGGNRQFLQVEPGPETEASHVGGTGQYLQPNTEGTDFRTRSLDEGVSTASFYGNGSKGPGMLADATTESVTVLRPGRSRPRSRSSATRRTSPKELVSPSEYKETSKGEMSELAPQTKRNYGSLGDISCHGIINGDVPSTSPDSTNTVEFTVNANPEPKESRPRASGYTPSMVDELRKRNRLYFLDPITKLWHFHGFPWKLSLQIVKVVIITVQIIIFGAQRQSIVEFFERSNLAFKHLLLSDWDTSFETMPYPPAAGPYAIYSISGLYNHMNYAMQQYHRLPFESLAAVELNKDKMGRPNPIELCFTANDIEEMPNNTYIVRSGVVQNCTFVHPDHGTAGNYTYDIKKFINETEFPLFFNRTLEITLHMYVRTYHLNLLETRYGPTCYNDSIRIVYDNDERSGQILVALDSVPLEVDCEAQVLSDQAEEETEEVRMRMIALDAAVIGICCLSSILCARSLKRSNKLRRDTARFFKQQRNHPLSFGDHLEYINMWYVVIICNDILTIVGSAFKIQLETRVFTISSANYELCSILLGLGMLLTYVGILRYLGFFKSYNVLILTVKTSFPHVLRFLVCAICLYTGFLFCGWAIFSPYNLKFRSLSSASECLFSLVNGDDMFVTFSALKGSSDPIWYVSRAYLYIFISLFIYVVISVFIAVIMDNYENLKNYYEGNRPDTFIQAFMKEDGEMPLKEVFSHVRNGTCHAWFFCIFPCLACFKRRYYADDGCIRCNFTNAYTEIQPERGVERQRGTHSDDLTQDVF
ncbi:mucolipin-3-like [Plakobranchus ocellatus]|uniref:Mucolipin-3-like n=1 Tax=Plakobranchus ocellatus TaxID=259542 RepID=A0AAV3ZJY2_9GAST|nr:mucolipin-3-like [Plakobranchus ocellatus]